MPTDVRGMTLRDLFNTPPVSSPAKGGCELVGSVDAVELGSEVDDDW
jgi:hypothetical protein